ncbi:MAG: ABC transporter permease subunit [Defluviitaleaceae bacterium]|nr:ABC transporter permease subunit [Defluviitaleaceae bacterium]
MKNTLIKTAKNAAAIAFWIAVWQVASHFIGNPLVLISPIAAFTRLWELAGEGVFWLSVWFSLGRVVFGFVLSMAVGAVLAGICYRIPLLYTLFIPLVNVMKSVPIVSFTVLALFWVSRENLSVFIAFVTVLPIVFFNTYEGLSNVDTKLLEMAKILRVPPLKTAANIHLPHALPYVFSAAASGLGFAFKAGVTAELIGFVRDSIGFNLHTARNFLMMEDAMAWTITIVLLGYIIEKAFSLLLRRVGTWQSK